MQTQIVTTLLADAANAAVAVLDLAFPRHCAGCGGTVDRAQGHLCWECFRLIEWRGAEVCQRCGLLIEARVTHAFECHACQEHPPAFDRARSAGRFHGVLREMLHQFKYNGATWLCADLADLLHGCVLGHFAVEEIDLVVPVPLHTQKQRERGYNQAALLAAALARRVQRPCLGDVLVRTRATPTQTHLHALQRRQNVRQAFAVRSPEWVRGRTALVIDDVMTTGATLSEISANLKRAGAWRVWAATVARG
jgi:ComF family protein